MDRGRGVAVRERPEAGDDALEQHPGRSRVISSSPSWRLPRPSGWSKVMRKVRVGWAWGLPCRRRSSGRPLGRCPRRSGGTGGPARYGPRCTGGSVGPRADGGGRCYVAPTGMSHLGGVDGIRGLAPGHEIGGHDGRGSGSRSAALLRKAAAAGGIVVSAPIISTFHLPAGAQAVSGDGGGGPGPGPRLSRVCQRVEPSYHGTGAERAVSSTRHPRR